MCVQVKYQPRKILSLHWPDSGIIWFILLVHAKDAVHEPDQVENYV